MPFKLKHAGVLAVFLSANPATANSDLSVEELLALFEKQKAAFDQAENSELGQTRGLKLVTVEDAGPQDSGATTVASQDTPATDPNAPLSAADPNAPLVVGVLAAELQVNLQISFGFDSAALSDSEKPKLQKMCAVLQQSDINLFRIIGHTDTAGSDAYNERLSVLRAQEVARHLIDDCGIAPERLETIGMGERFPFNSDNPRADENRRVEFQALS